MKDILVLDANSNAKLATLSSGSRLNTTVSILDIIKIEEVEYVVISRVFEANRKYSAGIESELSISSLIVEKNNRVQG
jgi:hypothetical protein